MFAWQLLWAGRHTILALRHLASVEDKGLKLDHEWAFEHVVDVSNVRFVTLFFLGVSWMSNSSVLRLGRQDALSVVCVSCFLFRVAVQSQTDECAQGRRSLSNSRSGLCKRTWELPSILFPFAIHPITP